MRQKTDQVERTLHRGWTIECIPTNGQPWKAKISALPFSIGRHTDCDLSLDGLGISRFHAELYASESGLWIRDLMSTNGTYVNRIRLRGAIQLEDGDTLHFGSAAFRIHHEASLTADEEDSDDSVLIDSRRIKRIVDANQVPRRAFQDMLRGEQAVALFQPLVDLSADRIVGYEILGRGNWPGLVTQPIPLFEIAERLGRAEDLSDLFRRRGAELARTLTDDTALFFNTHPQELQSAALLGNVEKLRGLLPKHPIVLEIHEQAVANLEMMATLKSTLDELDIRLAYDDLGAGYSRLLELVHVPPDYVKFDMCLIKNIHDSPALQRLVGGLVTMIKDLNVTSIAEGVESPEDLDVIKELGFDLAQGYHFGRPQSVFDGPDTL